MVRDMIFLEKPSQLDKFIPYEMSVAEEISIANKVGALNTRDLKRKFRLFHRFISYSIIPKGGHYNQVSTLDSFSIFRSAIGQPLNLNYLILKEMADVGNHVNRALPFGSLLTKVFMHFGVSFRDQHDQGIDANFTI